MLTPNRVLILLLGGSLAWGGSGLAFAQAVFLAPSLAVSEEYDDNIRLSATNPESDFITAIRPGLRLEVRNHPWYLTLDGSLRAEFFAERSELNSYTDNWLGSTTLEFRPTPIFSLSLTDTFVRSVNTGEVAPEAGITAGRFVSTSNTLTPTLTYQLTRLTGARFQYSFRTLRSDSPLSRDSDTHGATFSLERQFTPRLSGTLSYAFTRFQFEGSPDRDSHSPRVGGAYRYTPTLQVVSDVGPLFLERDDGTTEVTLGSSTRYEQQFKNARLTLAYDRNSGVAGVAGAASVTQSLRAAGSVLATRNLTVGLEGSMTDTASTERRDTRLEGGAVDVQVYTAAFRITYRLLRWLSLEGSYRFLRQNDQAASRDLERNVFSLSLVASDQLRAH